MDGVWWWWWWWGRGVAAGVWGQMRALLRGPCVQTGMLGCRWQRRAHPVGSCMMRRWRCRVTACSPGGGRGSGGRPGNGSLLPHVAPDTGPGVDDAFANRQIPPSSWKVQAPHGCSCAQAAQQAAAEGASASRWITRTTAALVHPELLSRCMVHDAGDRRTGGGGGGGRTDDGYSDAQKSVIVPSSELV